MSVTDRRSCLNKAKDGGKGPFSRLKARKGASNILLTILVIIFASCLSITLMDTETSEGASPYDYYITDSGTSFDAYYTDGGALFVSDPLIQNVIDAIKADAGGEESTITFGSGGSLLDIGTANIVFDGSTPGWDVTLYGRLTSAYSTTGNDCEGVIEVYNDATVSSHANIMSNGTCANPKTLTAIFNDSGSVNILGGTVESTNTTGYAIFSNAPATISISEASGANSTIVRSSTSNGVITIQDGGTGTVLEISGGRVENTGIGTAITNESPGDIIISGGVITAEPTPVTSGTLLNYSTGNVNISGGTVENIGTGTDGGNAIYNKETGVISISETSSANPTIVKAENELGHSVILIADSGTSTTPRLVMTGGTVMNTGSNASNGSAILNESTGEIVISGGTVQGITGNTIYNYSSGNITMSGGTVQNTSSTITASAAIYNQSTGEVAISGGTVSSVANAALYSNDTGKISISQGSGEATLVTSGASITSSVSVMDITGVGGLRLEITGGTVQNTSSGSAVGNSSEGEIIISGGTVQNTSSGRAISNYSDGEIVISGGTVENTGSGSAITNYSDGEIVISDGIVQGISGYTIHNYSGGKITMSGGTVQHTTLVATSADSAIYNQSTGEIAISGGTVSSDANAALYAYGAGKISISQGSGQPTIITSGSSTTSSAIFIDNSGGGGLRLEITGGTVQNTGSGSAIHNDSTGTINISDGMVTSTANDSAGTIFSYNPSSSGVLNITGGTVQNTTTGCAIRGNANVKVTDAAVSSGGNYAIYMTAVSGTLELGGDPTITGKIYIWAEKLSVFPTGPEEFDPTSKTYGVKISNPYDGAIVVKDGTGYDDFYLFDMSGYVLFDDGDDLILRKYDVLEYVDVNGDTETYTGPFTEIDTAFAAGNPTELIPGWYHVTEDVTLGDLDILGDVRIIIANDFTLTVGEITVSSGNDLYVYSQPLGAGEDEGIMALNETIVVEDDSSFTNTAVIESVDKEAIYATGSSVITNGFTGIITSDSDNATVLLDGVGKVTNYGTIESTTVYYNLSPASGILATGGAVIINEVITNVARGEDSPALIQSEGYGVRTDQGGTIENSGTIFGFNGVYLRAGGTVTNSGSIIGICEPGMHGVGIRSVTLPVTINNIVVGGAVGMITGTNGVVLQAGGIVNNYGTISGDDLSAAGIGIYLESFTTTTINNHPGGKILGRTGGISGGTVTSLIINNYADSASQGEIIGGEAGISIASATIFNEGLIEGGTMAGIFLTASGGITNHGMIKSNVNGIRFGYIGTFTITNYGKISGDVNGINILYVGAVTFVNYGEVEGNVPLNTLNPINTVTFGVGSSINGDFFIGTNPLSTLSFEGELEFDLNGKLICSTVTGDTDIGPGNVYVSFDFTVPLDYDWEDIILIDGSGGGSVTGTSKNNPFSFSSWGDYAIIIRGGNKLIATPLKDVPYVDVNGGEKSNIAMRLTQEDFDDMVSGGGDYALDNTGLSFGWFFIDSEIVISNDPFTTDGNVCIIMCNDAVLEMDSTCITIESGNLWIYSQPDDGSSDMGKVVSNGSAAVSGNTNNTFTNTAIIENTSTAAGVSGSVSKVINGVTGTISSGDNGVSPSSTCIVINYGVISTTGSGNGIHLSVANSSVYNYAYPYFHPGDDALYGNFLSGYRGVIEGANRGIYISADTGSTVVNYGTIAGNNSGGIIVIPSVDITNYAGGTITGTNRGIWLQAGGNIVNYGDISGMNATGDGIFLQGGGSVTNYNTIGYTFGSSELYGIRATGTSSVTLVNDGSIKGHVSLADTSNYVTFWVDSSIYGDFVIGNGGAGGSTLDFEGDLGSSLTYAMVTGNTNIGNETTQVSFDTDGLPAYYDGEDIILIDGSGGGSMATRSENPTYSQNSYNYLIRIKSADQLIATLCNVVTIAIEPPGGGDVTVTYTEGGYGMVSETVSGTGGNVFVPKTVGSINIEAFEESGYFFRCFVIDSGTPSGINPRTIDIADDMDVKAFFVDSAGMVTVTLEYEPDEADADLYYTIAGSGYTMAEEYAGPFPVGAAEALTIRAGNADGYDFYHWSDGTKTVSDTAETGILDLSGYGGSVEFTAYFITAEASAIKFYYITATDDSGSVIDPVGTSMVLYGENLTFTFSAKSGYRITAVYVDGVAISTEERALGEYTFTNVMSNHTIGVVSVPIRVNPDSITLTVEIVGGSGTAKYRVESPLSHAEAPYISFVGSRTIQPNTDLYTTIDVGDGYTFVKWTGDVESFDPELFFPDVEVDIYLIAHLEASGPEGTGWALLNLIFAILALLAGIAVVIAGRDRTRRYDEERLSKTALILRLLAIIIGIASIIIFLITEDTSLPMVIIDKWTLLMLVLLLVNLIAAVYSFRLDERNTEYWTRGRS